jgi:hypothetical protein
MQSARAVSSDQMIALRRRPAGAAIFHRPGRRDPALLVQHAMPAQKIFLAQLIAFILLAAQVLRIVFGDEGADLVAEGQLFGAEFLDVYVNVN